MGEIKLVRPTLMTLRTQVLLSINKEHVGSKATETSVRLSASVECSWLWQVRWYLAPILH